MLAGALKVARTENLAIQSDIIFRLNSFFSTEKFRRAHITTGTIFFHSALDQYFVAASPACDLVSRRPSPDEWWAHSIFPFTPLVAVLLKPIDIGKSLNEAANGFHVFFEDETGQKAFKIVAGPGHQPPYEFFIVKNEGRVRPHEGKTMFDAARLAPKMAPTDAGPLEASATEREWVDNEFEIVAQLHAVNATHVLRLAGQHLSRIGLDFVSMPRD